MNCCIFDYFCLRFFVRNFVKNSVVNLIGWFIFVNDYVYYQISNYIVVIHIFCKLCIKNEREKIIENYVDNTLFSKSWDGLLVPALRVSLDQVFSCWANW